MTAFSQLILTALPNIPLIQPGDDLAAMLLQALDEAGLALRDGDVLVLAQKIVSKAEGRFVDLRTVSPSARAMELAEQVEKDPRLVELILSEASEILRYRAGALIVAHRLGFVSANAGIDSSNVNGSAERVLLLPENPDRSCADLRMRLHAATSAQIGVIVNDSHGRAWRNGTVGVALGVAGVPALLDLRGHADLFNRALEITQVGLADELAAAASIVMGQADEGRPAVLVRGLPYALRDGSAQELIRPKELDLFR